MKGGNVQRGINLLVAAMLLTLGLYPVGAVSAQGARFLSTGERAAQAEASSSTRYVKPNGSTSGECQSWGTACDLQTALAAAISGDELWVAEGIYTPGASGNPDATFQLKEGVEIYGGFAGDESTLGQRNWTAHRSILSGDIDQNDVTEGGVVTDTAQIKGQNAYHVVYASDITSAVLDGFTITAGNAFSAIPMVGFGGGMYAVNSKITLRNVTFSGNSASWSGGGMYNENGSSPSLTDVTFAGNSSYFGGGMYNDGSSPSLTHVTFSGNSAVNYGGGMDNSNSSPTLTHVTFTGNSATSGGGGMYNALSSPSLTDVIFTGNSANTGGGMANNGSSPSLTNVTFSGNSASTGGGMYNWNGSSPSLTNAILWGNTPDQITNVSSTPSITYSDIQGVVYPGTGNINLDPLFVDAAGGNLRLQSTSPAIDAGDNAAAGLVGITTDLDGSPRKVDVPGVADTGSGSAPIVDMGAYEAQVGVGIIYVDQDAPGPTHDGTSWGNAFLGLQVGLAAAGAGSAIWVAEGNYTPGWPGYQLATFQLKEGVEIYGGFAGDETALGQRNWAAHRSILSGDIDQNDVTESGVVTDTAQIKGQNAVHVVSANGITSAAVLDGFTITAGNANPATYSDPSEERGGGMIADNSKITLRNVTFSGNSAKYGGGMYNVSGSSPSLTHVTFSGNSAGHGGGMFNNVSSSPSLTDVTFAGNSAVWDGGGMGNDYSNPSLTDVTFAGNSADSGGGMENHNSSSPSLTNVTLSGNSANYGGGMENHNSSSPSLTNVTLSGNSANYGGGMENHYSSSPSLTNAILWGNTPEQIRNDNGSTPSITYSDIQGGVSGTGNINLDPLFVDAAGGNLRLQSTSPAIDAGDNAAAGLVGITTDLDGNPRFVDFTGSGGAPIVDMGAYEAQITAPTITTQPQSQTIVSGQTATLTVVASGGSLSYQWYQGTSGDTSNPVGTDSDTFTTPALTSDTSYWVRVSNPAGSVDSNTATITIVQPPSITSANSASFTEGVAGSFTVTTAAGVPTATTISESGALPGGVSFTDNGDGTATLSGTPVSGTSGVYHLSITASNGIAPDATQDFTLSVLIAPISNTQTFLPLLARH